MAEPRQGNAVTRLSSSDWARVAWAAVILGAVLRLVWVLLIHPPQDYLFSDMYGYAVRAVDLAAGEDLHRFDAFYPPGTHMLLAVPLKLFGGETSGLPAAAFVWWALGSAIPFLAWRLAGCLLRPAAAALTAVLVAFYPPLILYAGFFSSETPALALLLAALWLGYRARALATTAAATVAAAGSGLLGAATIATRPQFVLNLAIVALPLLLRWRSKPQPVIALLACGALITAGVIAHNSAAADRLTGLNENGGTVFFQGHCDVGVVTAGLGDQRIFLGNPVAGELDRGRDFFFPNHQVWDQGFFYGKGLDCVAENGIGHAGRLVRNLVEATAVVPPWPLGETPTVRAVAGTANLAYSIALPLILIGAVALLRARRRRGEPPRERELLWHLLCLVPVVVLLSSEPRYRVPYDVFGLALLASVAIEALGRRFPPRSAGSRAAP